MKIIPPVCFRFSPSKGPIGSWPHVLARISYYSRRNQFQSFKQTFEMSFETVGQMTATVLTFETLYIRIVHLPTYFHRISDCMFYGKVLKKSIIVKKWGIKRWKQSLRVWKVLVKIWHVHCNILQLYFNVRHSEDWELLRM